MKDLATIVVGFAIVLGGYFLGYAVTESAFERKEATQITTVNKVRVDDRELVVGLADILVDTDQAKKGVTAEMSRFRQEAQSVFNSMKAEIMRLRKENEELKAITPI